MVTKTLTDGKPTVQGYVWQPGETEHVFTFRVPIGTGISFTDSKNLNFSIGKAELRDVVLKAKVRKSDLELVQLDITGRVNDLYDFDNEATLAWFGARVQAGFQAAIPGKFHGHIYESDVFVDKINYPFQFNFR